MKNNPEEGVMKHCLRVRCIFCGLALLGLLGCRKSQQNVVEVGSNVVAIRAELEKIPDIRDMRGAYKYPGELFSKIRNLPEKDERIQLANEFIAKLFADDLPTLTPDARSAALCARFRMACVGAGEVLSLGFKGADATDVAVRMLERYGEEIHFQKWKAAGQNRRYADLIRAYLKQDANFFSEYVMHSEVMGLSVSEKEEFSERVRELLRALPSEQVGAIRADIMALEECLAGCSCSVEGVAALQNSIVNKVGTLTNEVERISCARAYAKSVLTARLPDLGKCPTPSDIVSKRYFDSIGSACSALNLARCDGREKMEFCLAALCRLRDYCLSPLKNFKALEKNAILNLFIAYDNEMSCWDNAYLPAILKTLPEDLHQEFTKRSHEIVSRPSIEEVRSLCR